MNVNSGGPHLLLFERDQQLTALLTSEFQLAGYECHAARTAVEVFDAIARYPVRLVLVNLAQAAAGRREFWVALDAQRRGRGVQVFTFRCMNLAGYGADDPDERARTVLADMEVDGMLGVVNLVDAVRARIPGSTTGSMSRIPVTSRQTGTGQHRQVQGHHPGPQDPPDRLPHSPLPLQQAAPAASITAQVTSPLPMLASDGSSTPSVPTRAERAETTVSSRAGASQGSNPGAPPVASVPSAPGNTTSGFTDKIRAVIYPSSRNFSQMPGGQEIGGGPNNARLPASQAGSPQNPPSAHSSGDESGLEQLSRMLRAGDTADSPPISAMPLRASPIQDIAIERVAGGPASGGTGRQVESQKGEAFQPPRHSDLPSSPHPIVATPASPPVVPSAPVPAPVPISTPMPTEPQDQGEDVEQEKDVPSSSLAGDKPGNGAAEESAVSRSLLEQVQVSTQGAIRRNETGTSAASDDTLLNIVQSFPPMPSPPQQPQQSQPPVLSGRATRSLGSVLLEGHLVPQHRLEVAQHIQRMLRGVDMNYQLGEILLMFKLLTPDQLLAASLVSYGMISTVQISALGRIRQELHSIGLEYDLESLLVLFRILSPEQLREVRSSWSG